MRSGKVRNQSSRKKPVAWWREVAGDDWRTVVVIACGPSLTRADCETARQKGKVKIIVVNRAVQYCPDADILYACDLAFWKHNAEAWCGFAGRKVTWSAEAAQQYGLTHQPGVPHPGLGRDIVHTGSNSGYQAVNLAYLLGAKRIVLLGFDMQLTGGQIHFHGKHAKTNNPNAGLCLRWRRNFEQLAADLKTEGVELVNATRETALTCCHRIRIEDL